MPLRWGGDLDCLLVDPTRDCTVVRVGVLRVVDVLLATMPAGSTAAPVVVVVVVSGASEVDAEGIFLVRKLFGEVSGIVPKREV